MKFQSAAVAAKGAAIGVVSSIQNQTIYRSHAIALALVLAGSWQVSSQGATPAANLKPQIVIHCPPDVVLHCGESTDPANTGAATADASNCGGTVKMSYTDELVPTCPGMPAGIQRTWIATACGVKSLGCVQHIAVVDTAAPGFQSVPVPDIQVMCGSPIPKPPSTDSFVVTDDCDPNPKVEFGQVIDPAAADGSYLVHWTWTATDACGNHASVGTLVFVQSCLSSICGAWFYDANADGAWDGNEPGISGGQITLSGPGGLSISTLTDNVGAYCFSGLPAGTYTVAAVPSDTGNWEATTQQSFAVQLEDGGFETRNFGALCLGAGGAHDISFWSGKARVRVLNSVKTDTSSLAVVRALNLRNEDGSNFDPGSVPQLQAWLSGANAENLSYLLSAELAATALSVSEGYVDESLLVYAPTSVSANALGYGTIEALLNEVNQELGAHGVATSGSPYRAYQQALENALEAANANLSFVQTNPCPN